MVSIGYKCRIRPSQAKVISFKGIFDILEGIDNINKMAEMQSGPPRSHVTVYKPRLPPSNCVMEGSQMELPTIEFSSDDVRSRNHHAGRSNADRVKAGFRAKVLASASEEFPVCRIEPDEHIHNLKDSFRLSAILKKVRHLARDSLSFGKSNKPDDKIPSMD
jgi:hypothetical protein